MSISSKPSFVLSPSTLEHVTTSAVHDCAIFSLPQMAAGLGN